MKRCGLRAAALLVPLFIQSAVAQQPGGGPDRDHELISQLLERVRQLEAEVKELREHQAAANPPSSVTETPKPQTPEQQPAPPVAAADSMMSMPDAQSHGMPRMQFRGFSDISFHASDRQGDTDTFALGQFNLFITSKLSQRISVLAEAVVEADPQNTMGIDLERLLLQYETNDFFKLSVGRYHTAIGWYNTAYHHSTWMQTAVGRPLLFEFEDKGGILPIHNVGLSATGRIPSGSLGLHYVAEIGNGRTSRSPMDEPVQNIVDENNGKAFNFALMARPDALPGFQAGFSIYHDRLTPAGLPAIGQTIMAAHAVYQSSLFEWLNEGVFIRNSVAQTGRIMHTPTFYSQISRRFGEVRPYFRYQYINAPATDLVFPDVGLLHGPSVGIRYDFSDFAAFKIQYDRTERRSLPGINGVTTQLSFTF